MVNAVGQNTSPFKTKDVAILIRVPEKGIPYDFGSNDAESNATPTIAKRKKGVRKPWMNADVSKAILCSKSTSTGISYFQR